MSTALLFLCGPVFISLFRCSIGAILTTDEPFWGIRAVTRNEEIVEFVASGYANAKWEIPMAEDSGFSIGSNTKLFTSVAMFQMEENGILNLTDSIDDYLDVDDLVALGYDLTAQPQGIDNNTYCPRLLGSDTCETITFMDLISMNSGIIKIVGCGYDPTDPEQAVYMQYCLDFCNEMWTPYKGSINYYIADFINLPLSRVPGVYNENVTTDYSNPNYMLMQYFIEKLSSLSFDQYLKQNILEPLGMLNTYYDPFQSTNQLTANRVDPSILMTNDDSGVYGVAQCPEFNLGLAGAAGGMVSTVGDMHTWYRALFDKTEGYIPPIFQREDTVRRILTPHYSNEFFSGLGQIFAQGVLVVWDPSTQDWPEQISFIGGVFCGVAMIGLVWDGDDMIVVSYMDAGLHMDKTVAAGYQADISANGDIISVNDVDYGLCTAGSVGIALGSQQFGNYFATLAEWQYGLWESSAPSLAPTSNVVTSATESDNEEEVKACGDSDEDDEYGHPWVAIAVVFIVLFVVTLVALIYVVWKAKESKFETTTESEMQETA